MPDNAPAPTPAPSAAPTGLPPRRRWLPLTLTGLVCAAVGAGVVGGVWALRGGGHSSEPACQTALRAYTDRDTADRLIQAIQQCEGLPDPTIERLVNQSFEDLEGEIDDLERRLEELQ